MAVWTSPTTRTNGDLIGATTWNADLVENLKFLADPPRVEVHLVADQPIITGLETALPFVTEAWDTDTMHDNVTNTTRITCVTAGRYLVTARAVFANNNVGYRLARLWKNGLAGTCLDADYRGPSATSETSLFVEAEVALVAGDYVEIFVVQTSGAGLNALGATVPQRCWMRARMISQ